MRLLTTRRFERDLRRAKRRGKDLDRLWTVLDLLLDQRQLPPRNRPHRLIGNWSGTWECHIEGDWLLIWHRAEDAITLVRTGTHSDVFG